MKKIILYGSVIFVIILLISSISFPAIGSESINSSNYEVNTVPIIFYGFEGNKEHSVELTDNELRELENIIFEVKENINNAKTKEKIIEIYNDAIFSFDAFNLFPENMNIAAVQKLLSGESMDKKIKSYIKNICEKNKENFDDNENYICLTSGILEIGTFMFAGPAIRTIFSLLMPILPYDPYYGPGPLFFIIWYWAVMAHYNPIPLGYTVDLGFEWDPASSWLFTFGANGIKSWSGDFRGDFKRWYIDWFFSTYPGLIGFTGIRIPFGKSDMPGEIFKNEFILGFSLGANVKSI